MSDTHKHKKAQAQRQEGTHKFHPDPAFDGRRYGNKRKAVAKLKVKDRRRTNRAARRNLDGFETPLNKKHVLEY